MNILHEGLRTVYDTLESGMKKIGLVYPLVNTVAFSEPCQTSKMELFTKIVLSFMTEVPII